MVRIQPGDATKSYVCLQNAGGIFRCVVAGTKTKSLVTPTEGAFMTITDSEALYADTPLAVAMP
jgi:hypothetical protein